MANTRRQNDKVTEMDASAAMISEWIRRILVCKNFLIFFSVSSRESNAWIHRAAESKWPSPLLPKDWTTLHNIGQKYVAEKAGGPFWKFHNVAKSMEKKSMHIYRSPSTGQPFCRRLPEPILKPRCRKSLACLLNMTLATGLTTKR